ncbi:MAG: metallophosphoesterase [Ignavibacteria bacterium]|nr:metallophosphoesterase [Ignavibacteria bacterium]
MVWKKLCISFMVLLNLPVLGNRPGGTIDSNFFYADQVISRPSPNSVTTTIVPKKAIQLYYEWGTYSGSYDQQSTPVSTQPGIPVRVLLTNLTSNSRYFYRIRYKDANMPTFSAGMEASFNTPRNKGNAFKFALITDSHLYDKKGIPAMMNVTVNNIAGDKPDFVIDMGDTFGDDHFPATITQEQLMQLHLNYMPYISKVCNSSHLYLCLGNHEGEFGYYLLQTPPRNMAAYATLARKYYYANPVPDDFYSGDTVSEAFGMGLPENYYAWEWGDALFVVLDVYRYATANDKPEGWDWTLGDTQYNWLKKTLETSKAKFKFVFAHHVRGQGRGAILLAKNFEWGGYEANGTTWGFTQNRSGWAYPIHQLMVANGVNVFFQGHDHLFAKEELDGISYIEVPMPSDSTYMIGMLANADAYTANQINGSGHVAVTVTPTQATIDYIRAWLPKDTNATRKNHETAYSCIVMPRNNSVIHSPALPEHPELEQNYPNPFNPATTIRFALSQTSFADLRIFDVLGKEVACLVHESRSPGIYKETFNAAGLSSGIYIYRLSAGSSITTKKAIYIK